jgi:hypothetical protein
MEYFGLPSGSKLLIQKVRPDLLFLMLPQPPLLSHSLPVFAYHIQNQGAHANLFVDHSQIVQLACLRRGIWGPGSTFGRIVTFQK